MAALSSTSSSFTASVSSSSSSSFAHLRALVERAWARSVLPALESFVRVPNQSPGFDPRWAENGHAAAAARGLLEWVTREAATWPKNASATAPRAALRTVPGRPEIPPLLHVEADASAGAARGRGRAVVLYGHLDKQPPMTDAWSPGLHPHRPVLRDGKLFGRGAADDGYAIFAAVTALRAAAEQGLPLPRVHILVEGSEESGATGDIAAHLAELRDAIGEVGFVVCLDSGAMDYDHLWVTNSLRGVVMGNLQVRMLRVGSHSGSASGIVPSSFRVARRLLDRLEDSETGRVLPPELGAEISAGTRAEAADVAAVVGARAICADFSFLPGVRPVVDADAGEDAAAGAELLLNQTWRPQLAVTGADGLPALADAGNVLRAHTTLRLSVRLPPTVDVAAAAAAVKRTLEADPPYGAHVEFAHPVSASGWTAPAPAPWLSDALARASAEFFGGPPRFVGEGGSIPLMSLLSETYPQAQMLVTGLLGPGSNAHTADESLDVEAFKKLTCCVAHVLTACAEQMRD